MRVGLLAAALAACALTSAAADTPPVASSTKEGPEPVPHSIWKLDEVGNATHLESGWQCPASFGEYRRTDLHNYDAVGVDVSCNYVSSDGDITLYLTKRTGADIHADFESAKSALLQRTPDAKPVPDKDQSTFVSDGEWLHMIYTSHNGQSFDGVWYAWYGDWEFEIRATYKVSSSERVMAMLSQMTSAAQSARDHLTRCARSEVPQREGTVVESEKGAMLLAFTVSAMAEAMPEGADRFRPDPATVPAEWCAESAVEGAEQPVLLWHALNSHGLTIEADRATLATVGDPLVIESRADPELNKIETELKRTDLPIYAVTVATGDDVDVLGFFSHRPNGNALAGIIADIVSHRSHVAGSYNPKTKKITIGTP